MLEGNRSPSESRALVVIEPDAALRRPHHRVARCNPVFVAHLIAMHTQVPQMREKRRAEPAEAAAAYQSSLERFSAQ